MPARALRRGATVALRLRGAEALSGEATQVSGASATNVRLQFSVRYLIF